MAVGTVFDEVSVKIKFVQKLRSVKSTLKPIV